VAIKDRIDAIWRYDFAMEANCASECLYPSAKLHSCILQKFVQSISQNSYISVSEHFSLLVKQPIHEKRTVHRAPERVTRGRSVQVQR